MKPKKPNRFERIVLAAMKKQDTPSSTCIWLNGPDVVKLLRKEHRAAVRMVEGMKVYRLDDPSHIGCDYFLNRDDALAKLKKRAT
jgi:hypothetical protein